jgi:hypothetical protein
VKVKLFIESQAAINQHCGFRDEQDAIERPALFTGITIEAYKLAATLNVSYRATKVFGLIPFPGRSKSPRRLTSNAPSIASDAQDVERPQTFVKPPAEPVVVDPYIVMRKDQDLAPVCFGDLTIEDSRQAVRVLIANRAFDPVIKCKAPQGCAQKGAAFELGPTLPCSCDDQDIRHN